MPKAMPRVIDCDMSGCAYNSENACHAMAINVEEGSPCATCHTFMQKETKAGVQDMTGQVGACKMDNCMHNEALECAAPEGINISRHGEHPDCKTFSAR